jgi:hypothetical protein
VIAGEAGGRILREGRLNVGGNVITVTRRSWVERSAFGFAAREGGAALFGE